MNKHDNCQKKKIISDDMMKFEEIKIIFELFAFVHKIFIVSLLF